MLFFLYPTVIEIFENPSPINLSIILNITGLPFIGMRPEGMFPKIPSNSDGIFPALSINTDT